MNLLDLPFEVLLEITALLAYADRQALKLSCKTLYEICNEHCFTKNEVFNVEDTVISANSDPLSDIGKFARIFRKITFINVGFTYDSQFWSNYGNHIEQLSFINCDLNNDCLVNILTYCKNLEGLKLERLSHLFMTFRSSDHNIILPNLKSLEFCSSKYITDKIFSYFVKMCPKLNHLNFHDCENFCHPGIYKKFYPKFSDFICKPSDAIFSFLYIKNIISLNATHIQHLDFSKTMINGEYLLTILSVSGLNLSSLNISGCMQVRVPSYKVISILQPNLKHVFLNNISGCPLEILQNPMNQLDVLEIDGLRNTINISEAAEYSLHKLRELSMAKCDLGVVETVMEILTLNHNSELRKVSITCIDVSRNVLLNLVQNFKKLTYLNLGNTSVAVDDFMVRSICENLVLLRELDLTNCEAVTDRGLMGIDLGSILPIQAKKPSFLRIPLGSRVEAEIKEDVARKREIMEIMDIASLQPIGSSIMCLQGLRRLTLRNCIRISDLSLKNVFKFKELISLDIGGCQQITHEGISAMIPNVKSLERLDLSSCYNIADSAVDDICQGLKRLKYLVLDDCRQLTNKSLEYIYYSTSIRRLNVKGCENMNVDFVRYIEDFLEQRRLTAL